MNKPLICTTVLMSAALVAGAAVDADNIYNRLFPETKIVEYRREVRAGDTLWDIAETYVRKNTGTRRYILEYKSGIEENNPWLLERHGMIYPGDELTLTYWVKGEDK